MSQDWTWTGTTPGTFEELNGVLNPSMKALENKLAGVQNALEIFNVKNYGAVGDGLTDDSIALQNALTAAAAANGTLRCPPGSYLFTTALTATVDDYLAIEGEGAYLVSTISGSTAAALVLTGVSTSRISLRGFSLAHTFTTGSTLIGISVPVSVQSIYGEDLVVSGFPRWGGDSSAQQQTWEGCRFVDNQEAGFAFSGAGSILLNNIDAKNNGNGSDTTKGYGVILSGSNVKISGGRFEDNDRYGIDLRRSNNVSVVGAFCKNNGVYGIYAVNQENSEKDASNIKIIGCTIDQNDRAGSSHGMWVGVFGAGSVVDVNEVVISGNTVKNCLGHGILLSSGTGTFTVKKAVVRDNIIEETDGVQAINVGGTTEIESVVIAGNIMKNTGNIVVDNVKRVTVKDNIRQFTGSTSNYVAVSGDSFTIIEGNIADGTFIGEPFTAEASRFIIKDNVALWGVQLREIKASKAGIVDNTATAFLTITVQNERIGGIVLIDYVTNDTTGGARYTAGQILVQVGRVPGIAVQSSIGETIANQEVLADTGSAITIGTTFDLATTGGVSADNVVSVRITNNTSDSDTTHLKFHARFLQGARVDSVADMILASV